MFMERSGEAEVGSGPFWMIDFLSLMCTLGLVYVKYVGHKLLFHTVTNWSLEAFVSQKFEKIVILHQRAIDISKIDKFEIVVIK